MYKRFTSFERKISLEFYLEIMNIYQQTTQCLPHVYSIYFVFMISKQFKKQVLALSILLLRKP